MLPRQLLAHRGDWSDPREQNSLDAFDRAFSAGFGIETDLRDHAGEIVVSHDPATGHEPRLHELLALHARHGGDLPLALNIKADGLAAELHASIRGQAMSSVFFFDMSVPDTLGFLRLGLPVFGRHSELEPEATFPEASAGVWLDAFYDEWATPEVVLGHLERGKRVVLVSPELHRRQPGERWPALLRLLEEHVGVLLCTDSAREHLKRSA